MVVVAIVVVYTETMHNGHCDYNTGVHPALDTSFIYGVFHKATKGESSKIRTFKRMSHPKQKTKYERSPLTIIKGVLQEHYIIGGILPKKKIQESSPLKDHQMKESSITPIAQRKAFKAQAPPQSHPMIGGICIKEEE